MAPVDPSEQAHDLVHCIYVSASTREFSVEELEALLDVAKTNNRALNVTGMLLHHRGSFFQILEGEAAVVDALYEKISGDSRHAKVTKLINERIAARDFADWSMGLARATRQDLAKIEGLNDFFLSGGCFSELDEGRAKTLLNSFREGRWRATIGG